MSLEMLICCYIKTPLKLLNRKVIFKFHENSYYEEMHRFQYFLQKIKLPFNSIFPRTFRIPQLNELCFPSKQKTPFHSPFITKHRMLEKTFCLLCLKIEKLKSIVLSTSIFHTLSLASSSFCGCYLPRSKSDLVAIYQCKIFPSCAV